MHDILNRHRCRSDFMSFYLRYSYVVNLSSTDFETTWRPCHSKVSWSPMLSALQTLKWIISVVNDLSISI
uniref:Ovule protein n=1 Tax=Heterorhabditis bacteriophora TaxID=37862 RepID=A0A1I7WAT9_HETBA